MANSIENATLLLVESVLANLTPLERSAFIERLSNVYDQLSNETPAPLPVKERPTTYIEIRKKLEDSYQLIFHQYRYRPIHIAELRQWYESEFGAFFGVDCEMKKGERLWWKTFYNAVKGSNVFCKVPELKGHFRLVDLFCD